MYALQAHYISYFLHKPILYTSPWSMTSYRKSWDGQCQDRRSTIPLFSLWKNTIKDMNKKGFSQTLTPSQAVGKFYSSCMLKHKYLFQKKLNDTKKKICIWLAKIVVFSSFFILWRLGWLNFTAICLKKSSVYSLQSPYSLYIQSYSQK